MTEAGGKVIDRKDAFVYIRQIFFAKDREKRRLCVYLSKIVCLIIPYFVLMIRSRGKRICLIKLLIKLQIPKRRQKI